MRQWTQARWFQMIMAVSVVVLGFTNFGGQHVASAATTYRCAPSMAPDQAAADREVRSSYATWKSSYVTSNGAGGFLRVQRPGDGYDTVSEGIAYGMVLAAYLQDKPTFDGLWKYAQSHFDANGLMHWRIDANNTVVGRNAATDAEEDMGLALIVADKTWGGYTVDAKGLIGRILQHEVEAGSFVLKPGDVWGGSDRTNPSYFAPAYYKVFEAYTGEAAWTAVANKAYEIIANVNAKSGAGTTGLQPNWTTCGGYLVHPPLKSAVASNGRGKATRFSTT